LTSLSKEEPRQLILGEKEGKRPPRERGEKWRQTADLQYDVKGGKNRGGVLRAKGERLPRAAGAGGESGGREGKKSKGMGKGKVRAGAMTLMLDTAQENRIAQYRRFMLEVRPIRACGEREGRGFTRANLGGRSGEGSKENQGLPAGRGKKKKLFFGVMLKKTTLK